MAKLLISLGADVNARNATGVSPLHIAASSGATVVAEAPLKAGADVKAKTNNGETALHVAENKNHSTTAAVILQYGGER